MNSDGEELTSVPPNQTIYIQGLNDKISKVDLKKSLYFLFSVFGKILDIVALKTIKHRGQAFVVFEDIQQATAAMRALNGFPVFEKGMKISYAKSKSKAVKIKEGTLYQREPIAKRSAGDDTVDEQNKKQKTSDQPVMNNILFLSNLPTTITQDALTTLFNKYPGFKEIRLIPSKREIAFVEYSTIAEASAAKNVLEGFQISPGNPITISFAAK